MDQSGELSIRLGGDMYLRFPVGIEAVNVSYGTRAAVTQAFDAFWLDSLGPAIPTFSISGHTGYMDHGYGTGDGKKSFLYLVKMHKEHQRRCKESPNAVTSLLTYTDVGSGFIFLCFATNLRITREKSTPTLFHFEWEFSVVADYSDYTHHTG